MIFNYQSNIISQSKNLIYNHNLRKVLYLILLDAVIHKINLIKIKKYKRRKQANISKNKYKFKIFK